MPLRRAPRPPAAPAGRRQYLQAKADVYDKLIESQVQDLLKENKALKDQVTTLATANGRMADQLEELTKRMTAVDGGGVDATTAPAATTQPPVDRPKQCAAESAAGPSCSPELVADGADVALRACCGELLLHSEQCTVNPCETQQQLDQLLARLGL